MQEQLIAKAKELLANGSVNRVVGWKRGEFTYDITPAVFTNAEELDSAFVYDIWCGHNLSKYLVDISKLEGKTLVFLKPCDTYSFSQLLKEHRIARENVYAVGIECEGKADINKVRALGAESVLSTKEDGDKLVIETLNGEVTLNKADVLAERCINCKSKKHVIYDELIGEDGEVLDSHRFDQVAELEAMTSEERFAFWQKELSRCIRCNACRNVCPACTCENCVFDNPESMISQKAAVTSFEESNYHIIRAFHVTGRCTDCGECSRVCPQNIPLHLLNRKFIKDANELYGEYQAGADVDRKYPITDFSFDDPEPSIVYTRGGNK
ncbi:MAG: 4Fe-4S dicluster domain-containing protein [Lachnospiraceae bacterium]|nr:4Fe-4S dicluster domain-containing protein [Lachnospiraceae bacterium]